MFDQQNLILQAITEPKAAKNRLHLDIRVAPAAATSGGSGSPRKSSG
jgi:hypothetical protein